MKTQVETYLIEETVELIYDNEKLDQWNKRVEELGLEGQRTVAVNEKSPIPFMWMNKAVVATFEQLCPRKVAIQAYNKTPIPVEALDLVALSNKEGYFDKIEVWYNDADPDPCIVGYKYGKGNGEWERVYYAEKYLLARWSDVKAPINQLIDRAKNVFIAKTKNELERSIKRDQRRLEDINLEADRVFGVDGQNVDPLLF